MLFSKISYGSHGRIKTIYGDENELFLPRQLLFIVVFVLALNNASLAAHARDDNETIEKNEKAVSELVKNGSIADFKKINPKHNIITAKFLAGLMTSPVAEKKVSWSGIHIENAIIRGRLDLKNAEIPHNIELNKCFFEDEVHMENTDFLKSASFGDGVFTGDVSFAGAAIKKDLSVMIDNKKKSQAKFMRKADFNCVKVGGGAYFSGATFSGAVDFIMADIGGNLQLRNAAFSPENKPWNGVEHMAGYDASFRGMKVGGLVVLNGAAFNGSVNFADAKLDSNLKADKTKFNHAGDEKAYGANLQDMKIAGSALFNDAVFAKKGAIVFDGMHYNRIECDWKNMVENARYNSDIYANLEAYFRREGKSDVADEVFLAQKKREIKNTSFFKDPLSYLWKNFLYYFAGYGKTPSRPFYCCLILYTAGIFIFSDRTMTRQNQEEHAQAEYNRYWYNLDLLIPLLDLKDYKLWRPKPECVKTTHYLRIHKFLGWVFVSTCIAVLAGVIK